MKRVLAALMMVLLTFARGASHAEARYPVFFDREDTRTFTVYAQEAGVYTLALTGTGEGAMRVNGLAAGTWQGTTTEAPLQKGINTIAFSNGQGLESLEVVNAQPPEPYGATTPYITHEAESLVFQGALLSGDRAYRTVTSEASGRACVKLQNAGDYVALTLTEPANALVIRYCIPDDVTGVGLSAKARLTINGEKVMSVPLTSRHTWLYGAFPWSNDPAKGLAHVFFDDVRVKLDRAYDAGTVLRLEWDAPLDYLIVDLIDTELVAPPHAQPENSLSILDFGAVADDGKDDSSAINACILEAAKQGKEVFIPEGTFEVSNPVLVNGLWLNKKGTVIRGAGMWHTVLTGPYAYFTFKASDIGLYDFSMTGRADLRRDTYPTAITSDFKRFDIQNIDVHNIWIEHYNVGLWVNCIDSMHITGCRFRNTYADGINLRRGTQNTIVEQCTFRSNGDDGIAQWSAAVPDRNNKIRFNTIALPWLANNIALYGGVDIEVTDNLILDTVSFGGGVNISTKFDPQPFGGTILVARNHFLRAGSRDWDIQKDYGAIWINTVDGYPNEAEVIIRDNVILDSTYHSISLSGGAPVTNLSIHDNALDLPVYIDAAARGVMILKDNSGDQTVQNRAAEAFEVK